MSCPEVFIAALDVGTTTIRCQIINSVTNTVGFATATVNLLHPKPGYVEINPDELWKSIIQVIKEAIANANLKVFDIKCIGISTQRATFISWRKDDGTPFHNFITWKDLRATDLCNKINNYFTLKLVRWVAYTLYLCTGNLRFLIGSRLNFTPNYVTGRLLWVLDNNEGLKKAVKDNNALFGTVDTWLIYKFSKGRLHVTDISNAAATALYDPFVLEWGSWTTNILKIPERILPKIVSNDFNFGEIDKTIFGSPIPIKCVMADQSSSTFASCCFNRYDLKVTLGTGAFLDVNTGNRLHTCVSGLDPIVGWKINNEIVYLAEGACNDCGSLIEWLIKVGFLKNSAESSEISSSVDDTDGVYFISAFSGLGPPINDATAGTGFIGIKPTTTKSHLVRSVLESIAYRIALCFKMVMKKTKRNYPKITVDGGVSQNDFICQLLADLTNTNVERLISAEMSVFGVGFVAGLSSGVWESKADLEKLRKLGKVFQPNNDSHYRKNCNTQFHNWLKAVERFKKWKDN